MSRLRLVTNEVQRRLDRMFPSFFGSPKHDHYKDFGYPTDLTFADLYRMYLRNSLAHAAVEKTVDKTWQDAPYLLEAERDGSEGGLKDETPLERDIRERFGDLRVWMRLAEADRRSLVGAYGGVILRVADSKRFADPVETVPGGLEGLVELVPFWEGQLAISEWDSDERSESYGQPKMYQFNEAAVGHATNPRVFSVHPDRVIVWSRDGTVHGRSALEPGYNDLIDMEKIKGAGGEGFWKNAKSAPVLEVDKEANIRDMARMMGVSEGEIADRMNDQVADWQKGFDHLLMLQGMQAKTLGVTLPSPEHFWAAPLQSFAASMRMPTKILVGMQTGERASTEDAQEWAQTIMSRRAVVVVPNVMVLVRRLERFGILPEKDWYLDWTDLTEASMAEKIERTVKMADVNAKMQSSGEWVFTPEEIRAAADYEPLSDADKYRDEDDEDGEVAAAGPGAAPRSAPAGTVGTTMGAVVRPNWAVRLNEFDPSQPRIPKGVPAGGQWAAAVFSSDDEVIDDILAVMEESEFSEFGIRVDDLDDPLDVGSLLPKSRVWVDGDPTDDYLDGTSTYGVDGTRRGVGDALYGMGLTAKRGRHGYFGKVIYLVGGDDATAGEDDGERIIRRAKVLGVYIRDQDAFAPVRWRWK